MSKFNITSGRGFHLTFENGYTVSVQFGPEHYCENRSNDPVSLLKEQREFGADCESSDAEIAIWNDKGTWLTAYAWKELFSEELNDNVAGWLDTDTVAKAIAWAQAQPKS